MAAAGKPVIVNVGVACCTVIPFVPLVLVAKLVAPAYCAEMLCGPGASVAIVAVATPDPFNVPDPIFWTPSRKFTVPVGVPPPEVTVACRLTVEPNVGVPPAAGKFKVVVVAAPFTVVVIVFEVLGAKFVFPLYVTDMGCGPVEPLA